MTRSSKLSGMALATSVIVGLGAAALASPAFAGELSSAQGTSEVAALVHAATPGDLAEEEIAATESATGRFTTNGTVQVAIPATTTGHVTATAQQPSGAVTVKVGLGATSDADGALAPDGSVIFDQRGSVDTTIQATGDGVRIHTVIRDVSAPTRYVHEISLPRGTHLMMTDDLPVDPGDTPGPGGALIVDEHGNFVAGFTPPWATDANGATVPTHYELRGRALVQVVDHSARATYPVVADPYLGFDMIKSARWSPRPQGPTLEVTPTLWARQWGGGYLPGKYGWNELYAKYKNRGLDTNLGGMRDQHICHQQTAWLKATWNLDQWRPDVSYPATVTSFCNPKP